MKCYLSKWFLKVNGWRHSHSTRLTSQSKKVAVSSCNLYYRYILQCPQQRMRLHIIRLSMVTKSRIISPRKGINPAFPWQYSCKEISNCSLHHKYIFQRLNQLWACDQLSSLDPVLCFTKGVLAEGINLPSITNQHCPASTSSCLDDSNALQRSAIQWSSINFPQQISLSISFIYNIRSKDWWKVRNLIGRGRHSSSVVPCPSCPELLEPNE